jgi:hypothetical protein
MSITDVLLLAICVLSLTNTSLAIYFQTHPTEYLDEYWKRIAVVQDLAVAQAREERYWDSDIGRERRTCHIIVSLE